MFRGVWGNRLLRLEQINIRDMEDILSLVRKKAQSWLGEEYDEATRAEVKRMLDNPDTTELIDSFYKDLEFGTGGLRGIMGAGSNRVNIYTIGAATQGLANYINKEFANLPEKKVVIGHDCRNNSRLFAEKAAGIFAANGIIAYLFDELRPTPEVSFAIRHLKCQSGIVITASHNPKEYNGYKVYWNDGAQIVAPHDNNIIEEVRSVSSVKQIKFDGNKELIRMVDKSVDQAFIDAVRSIALNPDVITQQKDMKIVFSPIHGATYKMVPEALRQLGFTNVITVPEQMVVSGNFPTVESPNPEETAVFSTLGSLASTVSRSFSCNSISITSLSRTGSTEPSTWVILSSSKHLRTWMIASVSRMLARNLLPNPSPLLAPFTKPAISTISTVVGTTLWGFTSLSSSVSLSSGTVITPILGSIVQKGKLADCAFAFDRQLNKVDLPTLGNPTIPHFNAMLCNNVF
jgi:hypothetical protein